AHHDILQEMQRGVVAVPELPTLVARWPLAPEEAGLGPGVSPGTSFGSSRWGGAIVRPAPAEEPEDPALYFIDRHDPTLKSGTYSIQVQQTIQGETFGTKADFHVSGPRFHCVPSDILAQYPPPASTGDYGRVLPHVILTRSTLPWERAAMPGTPWLVLALFDNGEIIDAGVKPLRALQLVDAAGQPISADTAAGESDDDTVSYITVAGDTLAALLPTADELQLLTHVRTTEDDADLAVIFSNRLPQASGASTVHLLSVEGRYKDGRFSAPAGDVTLISLASWRFSSDPAAPTFQRRMAALTVAPEPNRVPLKHRLRNGQRTVSWYRSPFSSAPAGLPHWDDVDHADELLGMADGRMDVTYAAAWELGRLLTLRQKQVASQLYLWKRRHVRYVQSVRRQLIHQTRDIHWPADLPEAVADWFDALRTLAPVPLSYFVPSEDLLPP
ncbi:MAG TPA: hypothetical protein DCE44_00700, partial [Verrucomicrobiales bacterium]|nr:hypothetical protein [Verrucomicrobiales bacterium]